MEAEQLFKHARPYRLSQVVGMLLLAYVTAALLNLQGIQRWIEDRPAGALRESLLSMVIDLRGVAEPLALTRPKQQIRAAFNSLITEPKPTSSEPPSTQVVAVEPTPSAASPPEAELVPDTVPGRTLFVGDSIMGAIAPLANRLLQKELGAPEPVIKWEVSSGLTRYKDINWPQVIRELLAKQPIQNVVIHFGANDLMTVHYGGKIHYWPDPGWDEGYSGLVNDMLDLLCQEDRHVYWLGIPPLRKKELHEGTRRINRLVQQAVDQRSCATFVSTANPFGIDDNAEYSSFASVEGQQQRIRANDGIHFNALGGRIIAQRLVELQRRRAQLPSSLTRRESRSPPTL